MRFPPKIRIELTIVAAVPEDHREIAEAEIGKELDSAFGADEGVKVTMARIVDAETDRPIWQKP